MLSVRKPMKGAFAAAVSEMGWCPLVRNTRTKVYSASATSTGTANMWK
jgi:hypothetical protein